jgi:peptide deformylase
VSDTNHLSPLETPRTLTILDGSNPILKESCQPIEEITPLFKRLARDMLYTLLQSKNGGVGLAAPQVGISVRLVVMAIPGQRPEILFNPKIVNSSKSLLTKQEGCLSFPGEVRNVTRRTWVSVKFQDLSGNWVRRKYFGLASVCAQHELEHLDGKLFTEVGTKSTPIKFGTQQVVL